jgi:hypothetical protein
MADPLDATLGCRDDVVEGVAGERPSRLVGAEK